MRPRGVGGPCLPRRLLDQIGLDDDVSGRRGSWQNPEDRKRQRRVTRDVQAAQRKGGSHKKNQTGEGPVGLPKKAQKKALDGSNGLPGLAKSGKEKPLSESEEAVVIPKLGLATSSIKSKHNLAPTLESRGDHLSKRVKVQLAEDDAKIKALEKKLGIRSKGKTSKADTTDDFDDLLDGIDDSIGDTSDDDSDDRGLKQPRSSQDTADLAWLKSKRQGKTQDTRVDSDARGIGINGHDVEEQKDSGGSTQDSEESAPDFESDLGDGCSEDSISTDTEDLRPQRENPYVPPQAAAADQEVPKYSAISRRLQSLGQDEQSARLQGQIKGLVNRLSEANVLSIVAGVEKLYQSNARQSVSSALIVHLVNLAAGKDRLQETFLILHAGFAAALFRIIGSSFGAQLLENLDERFRQMWERMAQSPGDSEKSASNLMSFLGHCYNFHVISSQLIRDYIDECSQKLEENSLEIILRLLRTVSNCLRHDDADALKQSIGKINARLNSLDHNKISVRADFLVESINGLISSKTKHGETNAQNQDHITKMRKTIGSLNQRNLATSEPLRIRLSDLRGANKQGKWWLIGASFRDRDAHGVESGLRSRAIDSTRRDEDPEKYEEDMANDHWQDPMIVLTQLAQEQQMNTDIRRAIFVAIMSATDVDDAHIRLNKLRLKKSQELEIPKVVIRCVGSEQIFNPYYVLLARQICETRKIRMAFQFSLWDLFRRLGEKDDDMAAYHRSDETDQDDDGPDFRYVVHVAKFYGHLVVHGAQSLNILKILNLIYLRPKTRAFVVVLMHTIIIVSQARAKGQRDEEKLVAIITEAKDLSAMASSLEYFITRHMGQSSIDEIPEADATLRWGLKVIRKTLKAATNG